jgi:hypothetical protein
MTAPPLPRTFLRADLEATGFVGWQSWSALRESGFTEPPRAPGSYVIYRETNGPPRFVATGSGGHFKGRDPNVDRATLAANWVAGARTVYIGKATQLRSRLRAYANFGARRPVGHWGGRYVWQLADADNLLVAWRTLGDSVATARDDEISLLRRFMTLHDGQRPFANLTG